MIRIIDMEGTGLGPDARVCEFARIDLDPSSLLLGVVASELCFIETIPPEARAVHHIRAEDTRGCPPYDRRIVYEQAMRDGITAFAAHNAEYEGRFLLGSIPLICTYKAALRLWPEAPSHSVFSLLYWLEDQGRAEYDRALAYPPHRAMPDAYATAILLREMLRQGATGADFMQWTREPAQLPRCPIGDWRGHRWQECDEGFLNWILRKIWDREDVRFCAQAELDRRYQERQNDRQD